MAEKTADRDVNARRRHRRAWFNGGHDGFTLVEVLVAFAVLALLTVTIQRGVGALLANSATLAERSRAELVLRTRVSGPVDGGALAAGSANGRLQGLDWRMRFEPVVLPAAVVPDDAEGAASAAAGPPWRPVRIVIEVLSPGAQRLLAATETIRIVAGTAP